MQRATIMLDDDWGLQVREPHQSSHHPPSEVTQGKRAGSRHPAGGGTPPPLSKRPRYEPQAAGAHPYGGALGHRSIPPTKPLHASNNSEKRHAGRQMDLIRRITLPHAKATLVNLCRPSDARAGSPLHVLPEFSPLDFRPGCAGRTFLQRHGVVCVRLEPHESLPESPDAQEIVRDVNNALRARGILKDVPDMTLDDPAFQGAVRRRSSAVPAPLLATRLGSGHSAWAPANIPTIEGGLTLDRVGQSRAAWRMRARSAPVFENLFGGQGGLLADVMPMGFAVPGAQKLVSVLRPQEPTATTDPGGLYNALRPLRANGVLHVIPGMHLVRPVDGLTREEIHSFFESVAGFNASVPASLMVPLCLRPGCVYLWSQSMWAALGMDPLLRPEMRVPSLLVQLQRFRPLAAVSREERWQRQWSFTVKVRGMGNRPVSELLRRAGLHRAPRARDADDWWMPSDAAAIADNNALCPIYRTSDTTFPVELDMLTPECLAKRTYKLIGGPTLERPLPPAASVHSVMAALLPAEAHALYEHRQAVLCERRKLRSEAARVQRRAFLKTRLRENAEHYRHIHNLPPLARDDPYPSEADLDAHEAQEAQRRQFMTLGGADAQMSALMNTMNHPGVRVPDAVISMDDLRSMMADSLLSPSMRPPLTPHRASPPPDTPMEVVSAEEEEVEGDDEVPHSIMSPSYVPYSREDTQVEVEEVCACSESECESECESESASECETDDDDVCFTLPCMPGAATPVAARVVLESDDDSDEEDSDEIVVELPPLRPEHRRWDNLRMVPPKVCILCTNDTIAHVHTTARLMVNLDPVPPPVVSRLRRRPGPPRACVACVLVTGLWRLVESAR